MMRKIFIILMLLISVDAFPSTYYVAPTGGNDSNPGTINQPWATWQKAFDAANAGDTVYFRGGVWTPSNYATLDPTLSHGHVGTHDNPICFFNYPGESPIFDGTNITNGLTILIDHTSYIKFRGITVRNNFQEGTETVVGWYPANGGNYYFENCVSHDNGGHGWQAMGYDTLIYINCDSYNNYDPNTDGNTSDGFAGGSGGTVNDTLKYTYFYGCRAWNNSDDGFDLGTTKQTYMYNCWSFLNGYEELGPLSEGDGIKTGPSNVMDVSKRVVQNCISAFNKGAAFSHNNLNEDVYGPVQTWTNNIGYKCRDGWFFSGDGANAQKSIILNNNIVYDMRSYFAINYMFANLNFVIQRTNNGTMTQDYPFYTTNVAVTDADFMTVDSITGVSQMSSARKSDGSLPDITFLKPVYSSDLIDAGTDVGINYYGLAPDIGYAEYAPIIADHTVVDRFDDIPAYYIAEVKKMWVTYPGESHSEDIRSGMLALEELNHTYSVSSVLSGPPEPYTTTNLRYSRATWGDINNATGWIYDYGEEDWFTYTDGTYHYAPNAVARTEAGLLYINNNGPALYAMGFGWCWDYNDGINADFYLQATQAYIDYCATNNISTKIFFTTGPDGSGGILPPSYNYNLYLRSEQIRSYVEADPSRVLFDFQDILSYNDAGQINTETYDGHTYPVFHTDNEGGSAQIHMGSVGSIRLAKAMWWMLARMAGWDGMTTSAPEVDSTATDILSFTLPAQTSSATINATNHTVSIEVANGTGLVSLSPTITLSYGATISPTSGTARNFTNPVTYTVTALDETTTQTWTVTVTEAEAPPVSQGNPPTHNGAWIVHNGVLVKI